MAFLRFTRDPRGYENFYLVEPTTNRRGKSRSRVLYWFRTPPNVRVGRDPFDPAVRREIETQNPGVEFDWKKILETPIPSADVEKWRERRRQEKAEKAARRAAAVHASETSNEPTAVEEQAAAEEQFAAQEHAAEEPAVPEDESADVDADEMDEPAGEERPRHVLEVAAASEPPALAQAESNEPNRRRRRRRRGRRGHQKAPPGDV